MTKGKVLIDGDIVAYRAAFATEDSSPKDAEEKCTDILDYILGETALPFPDKSDYMVFLTGKGNFRYDIAKSFPYKGNRSKREKPIHLSHIRDFMVKEYDAIVSEEEEADDLIAKEATRLGSDTVVASIDKDMLQIPCWHFNFNTGAWTKVDDWSGLKFFYSQILSGDSADNIVGLYQVGKKTADKMLDKCKTEKELWKACIKEYDGDTDRVLENARLLWLRRKEGEIWEPPVPVKPKED
jgi:5'-3' exonuclease